MQGKSTDNVRRYRTKHRRIDYYPGPGIMAVIEKHFGTLDKCWVGVIDRLIVAGHKVISGNKPK